jgi:hypothetical protein
LIPARSQAARKSRDAVGAIGEYGAGALRRQPAQDLDRPRRQTDCPLAIGAVGQFRAAQHGSVLFEVDIFPTQKIDCKSALPPDPAAFYDLKRLGRRSAFRPAVDSQLRDARTTEKPVRDFRARRVEKSTKERLY